MDLTKVALKIPEVLLPQPNIDLTKWAVVACDQFTSQPEYWEQVAAVTAGSPSTADLIFPEVYLGKDYDGERIERIERINSAMRRYLDSGILISPGPGLVYLERQTAQGNLRKGLMAAVDLEAYDYQPGAATLIRATEGTVLDRLPPRVKIREQAALELPHIMVLIDDPDATVIEPLAAHTNQFITLYDTDLMLRGGHVTGYLIDNPVILEAIGQAVAQLAEPERFNQKYGLSGASPLLFAVGDGNHSLATAKTVWENLKRQPGIDLLNHPARYALVEIVNIHDTGLQFEPIHRVLFQASVNELRAGLAEALAPLGFKWEQLAGAAAMREHLVKPQDEQSDAQRFGLIAATAAAVITVERPQHNLAVGTLQEFLDHWVLVHPESTIDYIHGADVVATLGSQSGNIGFFLPPIVKSALFKTVVVDGVLPRKTFSMGEAAEKRYYLECRKIV
jgi:uncharacterized protein (DUF1015 family)